MTPEDYKEFLRLREEVERLKRENRDLRSGTGAQLVPRTAAPLASNNTFREGLRVAVLSMQESGARCSTGHWTERSALLEVGPCVIGMGIMRADQIVHVTSRSNAKKPSADVHSLREFTKCEEILQITVHVERGGGINRSFQYQGNRSQAYQELPAHVELDEATKDKVAFMRATISSVIRDEVRKLVQAGVECQDLKRMADTLLLAG